MVKFHRAIFDLFFGFMMLFMMLLMAADGLAHERLWRAANLVGVAAFAALILLLILTAIRLRQAE